MPARRKPPEPCWGRLLLSGTNASGSGQTIMTDQIAIRVASPFVPIACILLLGLFGYAIYIREQERKQWRATAYQEGIGEEYDRQLRRLLELERLKPKDAPEGPDPYREALAIARLEKRIMEKNLPPVGNTIFNISNSTISGLNLGIVMGSLNASVQILQTHGGQQIADAIEKLTNAIGNSTEIKDTDRKELLENVAQVSKEASSHPDQRRPGVIKACLALLTTSLSTAKELIPLVHDLYEKLKVAGIINW